MWYNIHEGTNQAPMYEPTSWIQVLATAEIYWRNRYLVFSHDCASVVVTFGSLLCHSHDRKRDIDSYAIMVSQN